MMEMYSSSSAHVSLLTSYYIVGRQCSFESDLDSYYVGWQARFVQSYMRLASPQSILRDPIEEIALKMA